MKTYNYIIFGDIEFVLDCTWNATVNARNFIITFYFRKF